MKKLLFLILIVFLFSCENKTCKTCTTVTTFKDYPIGPITITFTNIDTPLAPMTITITDSPGISPVTKIFEACGKDLKKVDGKVVTIIVQGYTITSKTTCK